MVTHYRPVQVDSGTTHTTHKEKPQMPKYQKADMEDIESVPEDTDSDFSTSSASLDKVPISFTLRTITASRLTQRQMAMKTVSEQLPKRKVGTIPGA